jgi:hypothetical protein
MARRVRNSLEINSQLPAHHRFKTGYTAQSFGWFFSLQPSAFPARDNASAGPPQHSP